MRDVYNMMLESYREGKITDERLDEAVCRVMAIKRLAPVDRKLLVYSSSDSLPYAFEILAGKYPAKVKNLYPSLYPPKKK